MTRFASLFVVALTLKSAAAAAVPLPGVDFEREVFPVLQRACFECHDEKKHRGELRLDLRESALRTEDQVIVPGRSADSELVRRISLPRGHDDVMPSRGDPLPPEDVARIRAWIDAGAHWPDGVKPAKHWAYVAPTRPAVPTVQETAWPRNPIDHFILARLERAGVNHAPAAEKAVLLRRVYLDLIGLPPTPPEVEAFVNDNSPGAYEKVVKRLLASPQFGERWARPWLDLARYADSHGFQRDDIRDIWAYRDWVIQALNDDMPFDRFTTEQLAGDLLPGATQAQKIATGFNRCAPTNVEAGSEPEETRVNQVFDRVNTVGAVWLGSTIECSQCHDHKYDPFSQKDYYQLFAFFNTTEIEAERAKPNTPGSIAFIGPFMPVVIPSQAQQRQNTEAEMAEIDARIAAYKQTLAPKLPEMIAGLRTRTAAAPTEEVLQIIDFSSEQGSAATILPDHSALVQDEPADKDTYIIKAATKLTGITGFRLEALTHDKLPGRGPGIGDASRPNFVLNSFEVVAAKPAPGSDSGEVVRFVRGTASFSQKGFSPGGAIDDDTRTAWAINPEFHKDHWAVFETAAPVGFEGGTVLRFRLVQQFGGSRMIGRVRLWAITGNVGGKPLPAPIAAILKAPADRLTDKQKAALIDYCFADDKPLAQLTAERARAERKLRSVPEAKTLVMQEDDQPRVSTLFMRGNYTTPGEPVAAAPPAVLSPMPTGAPANRLGLAQWLTARDNPLTARVVVNRWWAELFGRGIVSTVEDFGIKGDPPTHPELLDWLAVEFMEPASGGRWSAKHMLELMVTSATYRQSSRLTPESMARDDQNKLLSRGPRFRLDAEMIRDNALAISGLLSLKQFGPPIYPPQPDGLWTKVGGQRYDYTVSPGEDKYRRGLYVVLKRGSPYPSFVTFDATNRFACTVKRSRSNTPLQALTLLNDPVYVEAAMALAKRMMTHPPEVGGKPGSVTHRIKHGFRLCLARDPKPPEAAALAKLFEAQRAAATADADAARQLLKDVDLPAGFTPAELAAWYSVASTLLNLDETITKG